VARPTKGKGAKGKSGNIQHSTFNAEHLAMGGGWDSRVPGKA
jgi:hypothetical protein